MSQYTESHSSKKIKGGQNCGVYVAAVRMSLSHRCGKALGQASRSPGCPWGHVCIRDSKAPLCKEHPLEH